MIHLPVEYFERIYAAGDDPWGFDSRWYEARKYAMTLAALPHQRYARAFEPGCANGAFTTQLATRCEALIASELVPAVAARARARVAELPHVEIRTQAIPEHWPEGSFDLIVLSEVLYFLTAHGLTTVLRRIDDCLAFGGHVISVNWTGSTDAPLSGEEVHRALDSHPGLDRIGHYREPSFVLSVYERAVVRRKVVPVKAEP
ncbi:MAG TPA: SAM-dependent methyltransferase [Kofleriaceae bacterium]